MNEKSSLRLEAVVWLILLCGAALRFYQLGEFPFHPDEAQHAWFALGLGHYHYDPVYHGPLLYHLVAAVFGLIGASDFSARLVPAVLGVLLLWLALWPGRRFLGARAALWSGALLALSPVVVAYARRLLHDSLVLVLTLAAVYCFQVALEEPSTSRDGRHARLGLAALLALFLATKANAFFIAAMLLAFWLWKKITVRRRESNLCDWKTPVYSLLIVLVLWAALFRGDALSALPRMIAYWGGQQKQPRLPGPHSYYFVLMLLYELPIALAALWGAWCALKKRTPFTDLVLWWALTSLALYAIANEKVPWLLVHQILPMCLLAGYGLAQLELKTTPRKMALGLAASISAIFLLRHIEATNFERAADRHEPLLYAQTTGTYRDALFGALKSTVDERTKGIWIAPDAQWPAAWYLRPQSPLLEESSVSWTPNAPDESTLRVVLCSPETWRGLQFAGKFWGWHYAILDRYVWPTPSPQALAPQCFIGFWRSRKATRANGVLATDSTVHSVIAWRKPHQNEIH
jgi:uncharacterized protein (TIGR03663 family)